LARAGQPINALPGRVAPPGAWATGCRFAPRCGFADDACQTGPVLLTEHSVSRQARCLHTEQVVLDEVNTR
jgi:oligopeptide/dipeptide ABC transporter ATP-binding protein